VTQFLSSKAKYCQGIFHRSHNSTNIVSSVLISDINMASADGAKSVNDFIRRIALSSYKHSSSSTLAKGEAIVVDESARRALGDESVMEAGKHARLRKLLVDMTSKDIFSLFYYLED
jgi:hypothetical protein